MSRGPAFAGVHHPAGEERIARGGEPHSLRPLDRLADVSLVEVSLGPVEIDACSLEREPAEAVGLGFEELGKGLRSRLLLWCGHGRAHSRALAKCHPGL